MNPFSPIISIFSHTDAIGRAYLAIGVMASIADGLSSPFMYYLASHLLNEFGSFSSSVDSFSRNINECSAALCYLALGQFTASFAEGYCWTRIGEREARRMATRYMNALLREEVSYFEKPDSTAVEVVSVLANDTRVTQEALSEKIPSMVMNISKFVGFYLAGMVMAWRLVVVGIPFSVLLVIPGLIYGRNLAESGVKIKEESDKAGGIAAVAVSSVRTVYAFTGEKEVVDQYGAALGIPLKLGIRHGLLKGLAVGSNGVVYAIWSFLGYYGATLVAHHRVQGGTVFVVGAGMIIGGLSLGTAISNLRSVSEAALTSKRVGKRASVPEIDRKESTAQHMCRGDVEFRHVKFAYPTRPENFVLENFSLKIEEGKTVALVGRSGSGKSTVISLIQRFYEPANGEILVGGVDIRKVEMTWLRSQMGLVSQEPILFGTTVKENILMGKEDATMEEIVEAAKASNAHDFITRLPKGYDTDVGEGGVHMSGGQKQRIAIARALVRHPKILLLDEPTSALDFESERIFRQSLRQASGFSTVIMISHSLSSLQLVDFVAVVKNGHIVEFTSQKCINLNPSFFHRDSDVEGNRKAPLEKKVPEEENTSSFWKLVALNLPEKWEMVVACMSAVLSGGVHPVYTLTLGSMVSVYFSKDDKFIEQKTKEYSLLYLAIGLCSILFGVVQHYNFGYMGEMLKKRVREKIMFKVLTFEMGWFDREENSSGAILSRLSRDANVVKSLVSERLSLVVQTISAVVIACTMGILIAWRLAVVMIAAQPLVIVCIYTQKVLLKGMSKMAIRAQRETSKIAVEAVSNIKIVQAFSSQRRMMKLLEIAQKGLRKEIVMQAVYSGIGLGASNGLLTLAVVMSLWYGGKLMSHGYISARDLFQTYMILIGTGLVIAEAGSITSDLAKGSAAVASILSILDRPTAIEPEDENGFQPVTLRGLVEIDEVEFAYPARADVPVFTNLTMRIEAGKSTAILGRNGSGKSTVLALIERFYDPRSGSVKIDGRDIRSYNLRSLRRHIALVSQEPVLFAGTIKENIAYGASGASSESEIEEAARIANAHEFICGMAQGYETFCGDKGAQISGGQKQRIAIARAILRKPALLLLDEATSALDGHSESLVQDALERVMGGRTTVIVAHSLITVKNCDAAIVIDNGMVVAKGTPSSILRNSEDFLAMGDR